MVARIRVPYPNYRSAGIWPDLSAWAKISDPAESAVCAAGRTRQWELNRRKQRKRRKTANRNPPIAAGMFSGVARDARSKRVVRTTGFPPRCSLSIGPFDSFLGGSSERRIAIIWRFAPLLLNLVRVDRGRPECFQRGRGFVPHLDLLRVQLGV